MTGPVNRAIALKATKEAARVLEQTLLGTCIECIHHSVTDSSVRCDKFHCEIDDDAMLRGPNECPGFADDIPF